MPRKSDLKYFMDKINQIEKYVQGLNVQSAHGFSHTDRVRRWALYIAKKENFKDLELVEAAALLHDIGLSVPGDRRNHGQVSAELSRKFLSENNLFESEDIEQICNALTFHCKKDRGNTPLCWVLKDADMIDSLGPIGIYRGGAANYQLPEFDFKNIKSSAWRANNDFFDVRFKAGDKVGDTLTELTNFQASFIDNMTYKSSIKIARPLVKMMYKFLMDLEKQMKPITK